jgi:lipopolysaccharide transport system permease protein
MTTLADTNPEVTEEGDWSLVIEPRRGLLDLRLGKLWVYRDLVMLFVRRDFVAISSYANSHFRRTPLQYLCLE